MLNQKNQESGLAHFGIIISIILVVAALAFGGWWVWNKNQDATERNQAKSQEVSSDPSEGGKYLVIEEWGVRMPLDSKISDAKYRIANEGAYLSTTSIEAVPGCESGQIVLLQRSQREGDFDGLTVEELLSRPSNPLVKVDDYYYLENGPPADCTSSLRPGEVEDQKKFSEIRNSYRAAIKKLEQN